MGFFSNLDSAKVFKQSKWFVPGIYLAEISDVKFNQGYTGTSFVIETKVLGVQSTHPDAPQVSEHAVHIWKADGAKADIARNTWMQFLTAVLGCDISDKSADEWEKISADVLDSGSLNGTVMLLEVFNKVTKAGNDFTYHAWQREATEEDMEAFLS